MFHITSIRNETQNIKEHKAIIMLCLLCFILHQSGMKHKTSKNTKRLLCYVYYAMFIMLHIAAQTITELASRNSINNEAKQRHFCFSLQNREKQKHLFFSVYIFPSC